MLYLPTQQFIEYCSQRQWHPHFDYKGDLHPKNLKEGSLSRRRILYSMATGFSEFYPILQAANSAG